MVNNRQNRVQNLLKPARGQALVEYALILVLLAMALAFAVAATGPAIGNVFCNVVDNLAGEQSADICGRGAGALAVEGGSPDLFWATVTWVAANPQGETPFPTPIRQPPTSEVSVYQSPTPSQTPSNTYTPSRTPTPSITPTVTIGPSPTPQDLEFQVPHVDQIARPEWWRLASGTYWLGDEATWTAQYYDGASGFGTALNLTNPRESVTYVGSDLSFNWGAGGPAGVTLPGGNDTWGATFTRTFTIPDGAPVELRMSWSGDDHTQVFIDGTQVGAVAIYNNPATGTRTLNPGEHTIVIRYGENGGDANMSFSATAIQPNPDDTHVSCPWGQVNSSNDSNSATFQFENKALGGWTNGATCNLELRGWVDISGVTNPVLSFWDVWDFVGATADARLQIAEYIPVNPDGTGGLNRSAVSWRTVPLHTSGANYNWTRNEIPIGSDGGASGKVTFRFVLSGNGASNFRWHIDDLQIVSESLSPGTFTVGNTWDLNSRSQMSDFIFNSDTSKTLEDNPTLPQTQSAWRWDLRSDITHGSGTAWSTNPNATSYLRHSTAVSGTYRETYLEFKKLIDLSSAPATDHESDTGNIQLSFWSAYSIANNTGRLQVEYTRDARDTTPDNWTVVPNGGLLLDYSDPVGTPGPNQQTARTNLVMQYFAVNLQQIPQWDTTPFRLRFVLSVDNTRTPSGQGWYIDDIAIDRQNASPYLAYPFYDDAETTSNLASYWQNIGGSWGFTTEKPTQSLTATGNEVSPGALRTATAYSDSPNAYYASNVTRSLEMRYPLDLLHDTPENLTDSAGRAPANEPLLTFWHHREVGNNVRFSVELWTPAIATWREVWWYDSATHATGFREQDAWERIEINLRRALEAASGSTWAAIVASPATDDDDIKIRFKFVTDSTGSKDGVYIDEISISDSNIPTFKVWPTVSGGNGVYADHVEALELGAPGVGTQWNDRWYTGGIWNATSEETHTGPLSFSIAPNSAEYMRNAFQVLELSPIIDLTSTPNSTVDSTFLYWWMLYDIGASSHSLNVQISRENAAEASSLTNQYYGKTGGWTAWSNVAYSVDSLSNTSAVGNRTIRTWQRAQLNLNSYRGQRIRIRFVLQVPDAGNDRDIYFDDFTIMHTPRNLGVPLTDMATSINNWVPEGNWGLTNQYFLGTGETDAGLGSYQWVGWLFDCESHPITGSCTTTTTSPARYNTLLNTYPTNPSTPTCSDPQVLNPAAPVGPDCVTTLSFEFEDDVDKPLNGLAPDEFRETWAGRWVRRVDLEPGKYMVRILSRRGVRMWIDDVAQTDIPPNGAGPRGLPINRWTTAGPTVEYATFEVYSSITRYLTVEWFETSGDSILDVAISKNSYSFTDSPNTPSGSGWTTNNSVTQGNSSLISNGYFNFTGIANPQLGYQMLYQLGSSVTFRTEISTDGGFTWTIVDTLGSSASRLPTSGWEQRSVNLTGYANQPNVMIRFRVDATSATSGSQVNDGVYITDIRVLP